MILCRDCAHFRPSDNWPEVGALATCVNPSTITDPVTGQDNPPSCHRARGVLGRCGAEAALFEAKQA